ncbi:DMT family transporter [Kiloniella laminariae]|uniref:DMT family transporter n=1 Tax=Kiloniella laminariae TaxID=454162 RepID=A0ABT4LGD3_9PROT|nr:DMT family transporter [Kiloniella laminariae]MCZ4280160.1 DMT family transporter [Kiloniella laminariae]
MTRLQANFLMLIAAAIWGSTFVIQQLAMETLGPMTFTAARFFLGMLVVLPLAVREQKKRRSASADTSYYHLAPSDWIMMIGIGVVLCIGTVVQQIGIIHTTVTNAGFLTALYVPLVPLLGLIFFRTRPHWITWVAIACSLSGTFLISGMDSSFTLGYGDALVVSSSVFWGLHVLSVGLVASRTSMPLTLAAVQFAVCAVIAALGGMLTETVSVAALLDTFWSIAYAGAVSVGLAFTLQVVGQSYTQPADAALILSMETVFAALAGALFLQERIGSTEAVGCALILSAILMVEILPQLLRRKIRFS